MSSQSEVDKLSYNVCYKTNRTGAWPNCKYKNTLKMLDLSKYRFLFIAIIIIFTSLLIAALLGSFPAVSEIVVVKKYLYFI